MNTPANALYLGDVVHRRLRPIRHVLRYRVFSLLIDVDSISETAQRLTLFSHNRLNLLSLHDADHGDGTPLGPYLRRLAEQAGEGRHIERFVMLCYPRVLGYVFNPLTVYAGLDASGDVRLVLYEVSNTFGERMTYVLRAAPGDDGTVVQSCAKQFYVSPFNDTGGTYHFRMSPFGASLKLAITLETDRRALMTASFSAHRAELSDRNLLKALATTGWMTLKVITAIHFEAARLWMKGLVVIPRPAPPVPPVSFDDTSGAG